MINPFVHFIDNSKNINKKVKEVFEIVIHFESKALSSVNLLPDDTSNI